MKKLLFIVGVIVAYPQFGFANDILKQEQKTDQLNFSAQEQGQEVDLEELKVVNKVIDKFIECGTSGKFTKLYTEWFQEDARHAEKRYEQLLEALSLEKSELVCLEKVMTKKVNVFGLISDNWIAILLDNFASLNPVFAPVKEQIFKENNIDSKQIESIKKELEEMQTEPNTLRQALFGRLMNFGARAQSDPKSVVQEVIDNQGFMKVLCDYAKLLNDTFVEVINKNIKKIEELEKKVGETKSKDAVAKEKKAA